MKVLNLNYISLLFFIAEAAAKEGGEKAPEGEKGKEDQKAPAEKK